LLGFSAGASDSLGLEKPKVIFSSIDTMAFAVKRPSAALEQKIFSDPKLKYNLNVKYDPGIFERFMDWLSDLIFGNTNYENINFTRKLIIWTVIILCVIVVIWILMKSDLSRLIRPKSKMTSFNFSEITEDLSTINFDKMIEDAFKNDDYRTAVRWNYLKCLYLLEKGGHLMFQPAKTNIDYQYDLKRSPFLNEFISVSKIYDYVWYGKFTVDRAKYDDLKKEFTVFESHLNVQG
jgi:hypothetical protein